MFNTITKHRRSTSSLAAGSLTATVVALVALMLSACSVGSTEFSTNGNRASDNTQKQYEPTPDGYVVDETGGVSPAPDLDRQVSGEVGEMGATNPSPEALEAEASLRDRLTGVISSVDGASILFIDCIEAPCSTRLSTKSLGELRDLLASLSDEFDGAISFVARQSFDAYKGKSYQADVVVQGEDVREVPEDENELLTNN